MISVSSAAEKNSEFWMSQRLRSWVMRLSRPVIAVSLLSATCRAMGYSSSWSKCRDIASWQAATVSTS